MKFLHRLLGRLARLLPVVLVVVAAVLLVRHKKAEIAAAPTPTERPTPVQTADAVTGTLSETRTWLGRVRPWQEAELAAQLTARVSDVTVREGAAVEPGQVLVRLDAAEVGRAAEGVDAQVAQARAQVASQRATVQSLQDTVRYWRRELERDRMLAKEGALAPAAADATADKASTAEGRLEAAREALAAASRQVDVLGKRRAEVGTRLDYAEVASPFAAVVARRMVDPGDLAAPGRPLLVVEDRSRLRVLFDVPQDDLARVRPGAPVVLAGAGPDGADVTLEVSRLHPSLSDDRTLTVEAWAGPDAGLVPGSVLPVDVELSRVTDAVLVPERAIVEGPDGRTVVFAVEDGRTRAVPVKVRLVRDGKAAVDGLEPGQRVVVSTYLGWNRLSAGEAVEVIR